MWARGRKDANDNGEKMPLAYSVNAILGSSLVAAIIFIDYCRRYDVNSFQRKIFLIAIAMAFIAMLCDFLHLFLEGPSGYIGLYALYVVDKLYYMFQVAAMYMTVIFLDYISYKDMKRVKIIIVIVAFINLVHIIILLLNLKWGFYFFFSDDNGIYVW